MSRPPMPERAVMLCWLDATGAEQLDDEDAPLVPHPAWACGWLVEETDGHVTVALERFHQGPGGQGLWRELRCVPKGMILVGPIDL